MEKPQFPPALEKTYEDWLAYFERLKQPAYRAGQICAWIWKRGVFDPAEMTDFGKVLREELAGRLDFRPPEIVKEERAKDGTKKFLLRMRDGATVETALLKQGDRLTACLSTQAGCAVGCPFCLTGEGGFARNLTAGEIAGQLAAMESALGREINNVVFMGMGEPFLNTDAVFRAVRMLNDPKMRGLGIRHMTISTAGIIPGIAELAESGLGVRLAVSLHAADDTLRDELVPCNTGYPLKELLAALRSYQEKTGDRVTIEYALFKGVNDSLDHARALVRLLHGLHAFVNLIPGNPGRPGYDRSDPEDVLRFQSVLKSAGFESEIRVERGVEIDAACGQLRRSATTPNAEKTPPPKRAAVRDRKGESGDGNAGRNRKDAPRGDRAGKPGRKDPRGTRGGAAGAGKDGAPSGPGRPAVRPARGSGGNTRGGDAGISRTKSGDKGSRGPGGRSGSGGGRPSRGAAPRGRDRD